MNNFDLFDSVSNPIIVLDNSLNIVYINKTASGELGISLDNMTFSCAEAFKLLTGKDSACPVEKILHSPTKKEKYTINIKNNNDAFSIYEIKLSNLLENGKIYGYIVSLYEETTSSFNMSLNSVEPDSNILTEVLENAKIRDIYNVNDLEEIVSLFAQVHGVTSAIFDEKFDLVTNAHNFFDSCMLVRTSEEGLKRCLESDKELVQAAESHAVVKKCKAAGLMDAASPIIVEGKKFGTWALGEVLIDGEYDENHFADFAHEIGIDKDKYLKLIKENSIMSMEKMQKLAEFLYKLSEVLGKAGLVNLAFKKLNAELENNVKKEINKRRKQEQMLFEQKKFIDMGQMLNAIAHQWRQPLNNIYLLSQIMYDIYNKEDNDYSYDDAFNKHRELVQHMSKTIDDFSNFFSAKKENSSFHITKEIINTVELIKEQLFAKNISIRISFKCPEHIEEKICKDEFNECLNNECADLFNGFPGELRQVLLNLLSNAGDAVIDAEIKNPSIKIDTIIHDDSAEICVFNTGNHIPDDIKSNIFAPYFTTKEQGKGTGIGLYMSKMIVEDSMKGKIYCENIEGGVVFKIILPRDVN